MNQNGTNQIKQYERREHTPIAHRTRRLAGRVFALVATAALVGMAAGAPAERAAANTPSPAHQQEQAQATALDPGVIRAVDVAGGYRFEFVEQTAGGAVGVIERAPLGAPSLLARLTAQPDVTVLEVFTSVTPAGTSAPAQLVAAHQEAVRQLGRTDPRPRRLSLTAATPASAANGDNVSAEGKCSYVNAFIGESQWASDWYFAYQNKDFTYQATYVAKDVDGGLPIGQRTWYAGQTRARWLGACHGEDHAGDTNFTFKAQYKNYQGQWVTAASTFVYHNQKVTYYSALGAASWRVELTDGGCCIHPSLGVAVAGMKPLGLGYATGN